MNESCILLSAIRNTLFNISTVKKFKKSLKGLEEFITPEDLDALLETHSKALIKMNNRLQALNNYSEIEE